MPVDNEMENIICGILRDNFPDDSVFAEEEVMQKGNTKRAFWIDPHDGTSEFLKGHRETSISIGMVDNGEMVLGVVHSPLISTALANVDEKKGGFWASWAKGQLSTEKNFTTTTTTTTTSTKKKILVSTSLSSQRLENVKQKLSNDFEVIQCASIATRLALVATGEACATITFHGLNPWDFAAGQALLIGNGGNLYDLSSKTSISTPVLWKDLHPSTFPTSYIGTVDSKLISVLQEKLSL